MRKVIISLMLVMFCGMAAAAEWYTAVLVQVTPKRDLGVTTIQFYEVGFPATVLRAQVLWSDTGEGDNILLDMLTQAILNDRVVAIKTATAATPTVAANIISVGITNQ